VVPIENKASKRQPVGVPLWEDSPKIPTTVGNSLASLAHKHPPSSPFLQATTRTGFPSFLFFFSSSFLSFFPFPLTECLWKAWERFQRQAARWINNLSQLLRSGGNIIPSSDTNSEAGEIEAYSQRSDNHQER